MKKYVNIMLPALKLSFGTLLLLIFFSSCIEEFNATTTSFESILVIDAGITDELKQQQIKLSRTYQFEEESSTPEQNAEISIIDSQNNIFEFSELTPGTYISTVEFAAQSDVEYSLRIKTIDQNVYNSSPSSLIPGDEIDDVKITKTVSDDGEEGIEVNAFSLRTSSTKYYRYTYEETHQVIAPRWSRVKAVVESQFPPKVKLVLKTEEDQVCYNTNITNNSILGNSTSLDDNAIQKTRIKFISKFDYIIANRYSILVKQHSVSRAANKFYSLLKEFSASGNLFSQIQTGFIDGNIISENTSQKAIGFFDVSSVSSKRVFVNFVDLYPNQTPVDLPVECTILTPELDELVEMLLEGSVVFYRDNECLLAPPPADCDFSEPQGPYEVVAPICGDCTLSGTNIKPDFWID